ncbi:AF4/FMR2 family member lilli isoform X2 [Eurosta solidaginis]|uniref:AF4/FMR2 family member lilli isoform X2 n=1 Tax=Eurosta solidaginis TaxID=178769 RepID=UPI003530FA78
MDMKKIPKARMEDLERRQQREREKHKRQQVQYVGREFALFPEPRRVNPSEVDDDITAKLGDHSKAIEFMTTDAVGVQPSSNNALLTSHIPTSASSSSSASGNPTSIPASSSSSSQRLMSCPTSSQASQPQQSTPQLRHYQQQLPYRKQTDNKPPYSGRGGYPGQPVKNDLRSSGGMAPPKGPPLLLPPPTSTISTASINSVTRNSSSPGNNSGTNTAGLLPPPPNGYVGPPKSSAPLHNGRFSKPLPKSINDIISKVDQTYRAPEQITKIAATPRTTIGEYNLNGPNRHKYSVGPIQPILGSPPSGAELLQSNVPAPITPITPISGVPAVPNPLAVPNTGTITAVGSSGVSTTVSAILTTATTTASSTSEPILSGLKATPVTSSIRPILPMPKEPSKPLLVDKVGSTLEKQNSTLENDLELSESDDDRRKQGRSRHNSSDSSPSDSSESGSEESSKSDHQKQQQKLHAHHAIQQQQILQQQAAPTVGRSGVSISLQDKPKVIETISGGRSSIYLSSNVLGSAGSSSSGPSSTSSSSNKTPSPSDSSKWHLSRYFNKKPAQAQNENPTSTNSLVVNSINVSMDEPTLLPGGAQIIPEATQSQPHMAIVKHEAASFGVTKNFDVHDDDEEEIGGVRRNCGNNSGTKSSIGGAVPELLNEIKKESEVIYSNSLLKASCFGSAQTNTHGISQQQTQVPLLNAADFVAIPSSQIKHEASGLSTTTTTTNVAPMSLAGGTTTVTPYNTSSGSGRRRTPSVSPQMRTSASTGMSKSAEHARVNRLSAAPSDVAASNSSDDEDDMPTSVRSTVPTLGPGGTLKIPGVPAAITALPPSPQPLPPAPTLPNSITVVPIDPLPTTAPTSRKRKPRNSTATVTSHLETSDEENITSTTSALKSSGVTVSAAALKAAARPGGKFYTEPVAAVTMKKGPGRPRKSAGGGTVSNPPLSSATAAKGPTLTAKKDVANSSTASTKKTTARRRASKQNSTAATSKTQTQQPLAPTLPRAPSIDSSSSSSVSYLTSKTSSSSDTDEEEGVISGPSSYEEGDATGAGVGASTTNRIIVQLNKRKSSHDDVPPTSSVMLPAGLGKTNNAVAKATSGSSKRRRTKPKITPNDEVIDSDDDSSDSGSGSDSSVGNYVTVAANSTADVLPGTTTGNATVSSTHRSQNLQSPYKGSIPAAPISPSTSSSSSGSSSSSRSSSSGGEHSDTDRRTSSNSRCKSKHLKSGAKASAGSSNSASGGRLRRDKPKASDKNKNVTLTRIFNPKEGGAKKQGQVLVIDQSSGEQIGDQQKLISPNSSGYRAPSVSTAAVSCSQDNTATISTTFTSQSPRLTPGHMKSPRALPQLTTAGSHRTPDLSSRSSAERKVQQQRIKTPSCTPTRTPPTTRTPTPTSASLLSASTFSSTATVSPHIPSLICRVELSRLQRIPPEWRTNTYRLSGGTSAMPRYSHHENILSVDLQATTARLAASTSGNVTPYSTGNRTPTTPHAPSDRERSRSRESLVGAEVNGVAAGGGAVTKQRLNSTGPLSNRSTDGGGTTPKEKAELTLTGYTVPSCAHNSPSTKELKHEQLIKIEPGMELESIHIVATNKSETYCSETKFITSNSVKQELLLLKQDYKPGLSPSCDYVTSEKQGHHEEESGASRVLQHLRVSEVTDAKTHRRKRSASSSPYKEKKRKKERTDKYPKEGKEIKEVKDSETLLTPATTCKEKEKDITKPIATVGAIERDIGGGGIGGLGSANDTSRRAIAIIPPLGMNNNGQIEDHQHVDNRQLPHTNHDRLLITRQLHQQQQLTNVGTSNSSHSPAHLQTPSNTLVTPAILNVPSSNVMPPNSSPVQLAPPPPQVIYRSYFERDDDGRCDDICKNTKFLQEAVKRKHAADKEPHLFNQVTLYLEAVIYFLLASAGLEQHRNSEEAAWVMYKDTLNLIKFISSKFKHLQVLSATNELHEPHNKVAILSLRCQSLISLKLYKMKRAYCRTIINHCMEIFKSGRTEILNGNTPSSNSPSNSVCSQGSGSNTPPGRNMRQDMHTTLSHQNLYFNYLANCHDLWDQADRLVRQGNHTDFFIALDHENGPLTLHSSMYDLFRYVQSGLKKLKSANTTATTTTTTITSGSSASATTNNSVASVGASTTTSTNITTTSTSTTTINNYSNSVSATTLQSQ